MFFYLKCQNRRAKLVTGNDSRGRGCSPAASCKAGDTDVNPQGSPCLLHRATKKVPAESSQECIIVTIRREDDSKLLSKFYFFWNGGTGRISDTSTSTHPSNRSIVLCNLRFMFSKLTFSTLGRCGKSAVGICSSKSSITRSIFFRNSFLILLHVNLERIPSISMHEVT